jgi:hypothetical protein
MESFMEHMLILDEEKNKWTKRTRDMSGVAATPKNYSDLPDNTRRQMARNTLRRVGRPMGDYSVKRDHIFIRQGRGKDAHYSSQWSSEVQKNQSEKKHKEYYKELHDKLRRSQAAGDKNAYISSAVKSELPKKNPRLLSFKK